jgi:hypothetical protein
MNDILQQEIQLYDIFVIEINDINEIDINKIDNDDDN